MKGIHIGDQDLVGNKFNGHDLHLCLNEMSEESTWFHFVTNKLSDDPTTICIPSQMGKVIPYDILCSEHFLNADIVHLHLIHNDVIDISHLPILSKFKPLVWTIHDPWAVGGGCIHHFDCDKWKSCCFDCEYLDKPFSTDCDDRALHFINKKDAIQRSNISAIVSSPWIKSKIEDSPIWKDKKIYHLTYGINQNIFKPADDKDSLKTSLGIPKENIVLFFRADKNPYKGYHVIRDALLTCSCDNITLIAVNGCGLLEEFRARYQVIEFGWLKDDIKLAQLYQVSDLFLMPSIQETFGMMAVEAMSCGAVPLVLEGTALPYVVNSPECGLAVARKDFSSALELLLNNSEERHTRRKACLAYAQKVYDRHHYIASMVEIYNDVIKNFTIEEENKVVLEQLKKNASNIYYSYATTEKRILDNIFTIRNKLRIFRKYYWYKLLSKITSGKRRKHYIAKRHLWHGQVCRLRELKKKLNLLA